MELNSWSGQQIPLPGRRGGTESSLLGLGLLGWGTDEGTTLRFAAKSTDALPVPADSAPVGWVGLTYHAGGVPRITPEDDTSCTQGCTLANGGDEIHLRGKEMVTGEY